MTYRRRRIRGAMIGARGATLLDRHFAEQLERMAAIYSQHVSAESRLAAEEIRDFAAECRAAADERASEVGRSVLPIASQVSASERQLAVVTGLTTQEVAERFGYAGSRQVINLIKAGRLSATLHNGRHIIDEASVAAEVERRRTE